MSEAASPEGNFEAEIAAAVDAGFAEQIAYTRDLVRHRSLRGGEGPVQDFIFDALARRGYRPERFEMDREALARHPGAGIWTEEHSTAPIVVGTSRPREVKGRSLILQGHVDVVPPGPAATWRHDPFDPVIDGDWMYGRGAGDMKAGHAAALFALDALARMGYRPAATVYFQSVVEEESTGDGALSTHLRGYKADAVLIPEPQGLRLARATIGVIWFKLRVDGRPVHVLESTGGANAIEAMYLAIGHLKTIEADWNTRKASSPAFREHPHPINLNVGKIAGGDWASSVPSWCEADCRIAIFPGTPAREGVEELTSRLRDLVAGDPRLAGCTVTVVPNGFHAEGFELARGSEAEETLRRNHERVVGAPLEDHVPAAYIDTRVYALYDQIPALCYGPTAVDIHGIDERVSLESIRQATRVIAAFIADWCGLEKI